MIDLKAIPGIRSIGRTPDGGWRIGAAVSGAQLGANADLVRDWPGVVEEPAFAICLESAERPRSDEGRAPWLKSTFGPRSEGSPMANKSFRSGVGEMLDALVAAHPGLAAVLESGVSVIVDGKTATRRQAPVLPGSEVYLLQQLQGE
ncbi:MULTISPECIES: hypothetical protein [unclassified Bradyrhizobium]|uniref:hypothetical protein n=1 Tax=unclassified Bradyrhizobium TaxID=2631580 RepID=UPI001FFF2380|nr:MULTISPECIES: hypothetical protein [unclassified Bradyrhizobium]